jgi:environmental stress-induced protein Ves
MTRKNKQVAERAVGWKQASRSPNFSMKLIKKENQTVSKWSGGTTTQLFIYPPEALYTDRDFLFRISTATVETETSTFTSLAGYQRILIILKGALEITHAGQYTKTLNTFDTDLFDGGWETSAKGKVTDFNIMFRPEHKTNLTVEKATRGEIQSVEIDSLFGFGYLVSGAMIINDIKVLSGDFIVFDPDEKYTLSAEQTAVWLKITIS